MGTCPSKPGKLNGTNVDNFVMADKGKSAKPGKLNGTNVDNFVMADKGKSAEPKNNGNPKPVEKEEKIQNGPTMVGGKRKHRKTQRKSKKRSSSHK